MRRVLFTGMSGTGKSTLLAALHTDHNTVIDLDDGWMVWDEATGERGIDIERVLRLFQSEPNIDYYLAGTAANQGKLFLHLTAVITLTAPVEVMRSRILARTSNPFGKRETEWAQILQDREEIEPLLIRSSHYVCDTNRPLEQVVADVLDFLEKQDALKS